MTRESGSRFGDPPDRRRSIVHYGPICAAPDTAGAPRSERLGVVAVRGSVG